MIRSLRLRRSIAIALAMVGLAQTNASAWKFGNGTRTDHGVELASGTGPFAQIEAAANAATRCSDLSPAKLTALMMAPTWRESASDSQTDIPAPMNLSRNDYIYDAPNEPDGWDANKGLYWHDNGAEADVLDLDRRLFWHSALGLWQMDDYNDLFTEMGWDRFFGYKTVALRMATLYCRYVQKNPTATPIDKRHAAWADWTKCLAVLPNNQPNLCDKVFESIFQTSPNDHVVFDDPVNPDDDVDYLGGLQERKCRFQGIRNSLIARNDSGEFTCYFVDPANADNDANGYFSSVDGDDDGTAPSPLAYKFYIYTLPDGDYLREYRVWLDEDIPEVAMDGYDQIAMRTFGHNSRYLKNRNKQFGGITWERHPSAGAGGLCDITVPTAPRGHCS